MKYEIMMFVFLFSNSQTYLLDISNIFIGVKTTQKYEKSRLPIIVNTWFSFAKSQTWFFTDGGNTAEFWYLQKLTYGHMIVTRCGTSHKDGDLCCKTGVQLSINLSNNTLIRWLCLFDDDHYVNVPNLLTKLKKYDPTENWYLSRKKKGVDYPAIAYEGGIKRVFYYGTLGQGVCLSRPLLLKIQSYLRKHYNDSFVQLCNTLRRPDDVSLGFLIDKLRVDLTDLPGCYSHRQNLKNIKTEELKDLISVGYLHTSNKTSGNVINVRGFCKKKDPTRFFSLHCFLGYCANATHFENSNDTEKEEQSSTTVYSFL